MINNKRGISTIVVTIILVALVLIAVGMVWAVINRILTRSTGTTEVQSKCVEIDVQATSVICDGLTASEDCVVRIEKSRGSATLTGVALVFENGTAVSGRFDDTGDVPALVGRDSSAHDTGLSFPSGSLNNKVEVTAFFTDSDGNIAFCPTTTSFTF